LNGLCLGYGASSRSRERRDFVLAEAIGVQQKLMCRRNAAGAEQSCGIGAEQHADSTQPQLSA